MKRALMCFLILAVTSVAQAKTTAPTEVIQGALKALQSEGLIHADDVDATKTWSEEIASQTVEQRDALRKVYLLQFQSRRGEMIRAIAKWDTSPIPERSGLVIYVISQILQPDGIPTPPNHR